MKQLLRHSILYFVLLTFLLSTNGMLIYHHFCACHQQSYVAVIVDRDCCTGMNQNENCENENCCHSKKHHADKEIQNPETCKKEISFIKVPTVTKNDQTNQTLRIISSEFFTSVIFSFLQETDFSTPKVPPPIKIPESDFHSLYCTFLI